MLSAVDTGLSRPQDVIDTLESVESVEAARAALMARFGWTSEQADGVLDMQFRRFVPELRAMLRRELHELADGLGGECVP